MFRIVSQVLLFALPWPIRRRVLNTLFGYHIHPTAKVGFSLILARRLEMADRSRIHHLVCCKGIDKLELGVDSGIASLTYITGFSTRDDRYFKGNPNRLCELVMGRSSGITSRHFIDCNGGVYIGDFTTVAGLRTQILTHSINVYANRQQTSPVRIGNYCFLGTGCIILPGAALPDYSILGGGAVLTKAFTESHTLYAGNPARPIKKLNHDTTQYFKRTKHVVD